MASTIGYGVSLQRDGVPIAEVKDFSGPSLSRDAIEKTHHASPDMWREFLKGLKDGGEVTITVNYDPAEASHSFATGIVGDFTDDTTISTWTITFPDAAGTVWTFPGFVTDFEPAPDLEDMFTADVTIKVAGKPTLA